MTLQLPVILYTLLPRHTLKAALKAKANDVERRFIGVAKPLSCSFAQLVAWALDTGYGATQDQATCLGLTASEQGELRRYLWGRMSMLMQLVQLNGTNTFVPRTFVRLLDSSEKADASFILGGLACRLAHEKWFQERGAEVTRFWHLAVYEKHAARWISSVASKGKSRPDFLVQDSNGKWFPAEAKGSFDDADWARIQAGLRQASRLQSVTFVDPTTLSTTTQSVSDFACVMGHCATSSQLTASLVDPATDDSAPITLELAPQFADANAFLAAIRQFRLLGRQARLMNPSTESDFLGYETRYLGLDPFFREHLVIGIPVILLESEGQLHAFMCVAQHFANAFNDYFRRCSDESEDAAETNWATFLASQTFEAAFGAGNIADAEVFEQMRRMFTSTVKELADLVASNREKTASETTWGKAMLRLSEVPMFLRGNQHLSLQQWLEELRMFIQSAALAARLEATISSPRIDQRPGVSVASSLSGLIVVHGAAPKRVRQEAKMKFKI